MNLSELAKELHQLSEEDVYGLVAIAAAEVGVSLELRLLEKVQRAQASSNWCLLHNNCKGHCTNCYGSSPCYGHVQGAVLTIEDFN
jgi:hypothetical protein